MSAPHGTWPEIAAEVAQTGLSPRGAFATDGTDADLPRGAASLVLLGFVGGRGWETFRASPEAQDGAPHPLDRWSRRLIDTLAAKLEAQALYPFGGPPHWPFQRWALRVDDVHPSPIGLLIHGEHGLWHSYRGALAFAHDIGAPARAERASPCETCATKPCLTTCPVGAFTPGRYDVAACAAWIASPQGVECLEGGCLARRACPVGTPPPRDQRAFSMRAFLRARRE